jgi:hypothetical protein
MEILSEGYNAALWQRMTRAANRASRLLADSPKDISASVWTFWHFSFWPSPNIRENIIPSHSRTIRLIIFRPTLLLCHINKPQIVYASVGRFGRAGANEIGDYHPSEDTDSGTDKNYYFCFSSHTLYWKNDRRAPHRGLLDTSILHTLEYPAH